MNKNNMILPFIIVMLLTNILVVFADNTVSQAEINFENKMTDLSVNDKPHWAKDFIDRLVEKQIVAGYPDGTFKPNNSVEVDSFIKMVVCALGNNFEIGKEYWAMPFIEKAKELKLIDGSEFDTYRRIITREEAAKIIVNALAINEQLPNDEQINKYITKVPDYSKIADKYKKHALYAYATGMIVGDDRGSYNPRNNLSRAEAATIIMRLLDASLRNPVNIDEYLSGTLPELLKYDEDVWMLNDRKASMNISSIGDYYDLQDGKIYFTLKPYYENYRLKETINPDINRQVYELTKVLLDKGHYVSTSYVPHYGDQAGKAHVTVASSSAFAASNSFLIHFILFEDQKVTANKSINTFSKDATIRLTLKDLRNNTVSGIWSTPFYEDKLKKSCIVLFGQDTGKKIYDYIFNVYTEDRIKQDPKQRYTTKTIDNVQIDFFNESATLYFYFTINK